MLGPHLDFSRCSTPLRVVLTGWVLFDLMVNVPHSGACLAPDFAGEPNDGRRLIVLRLWLLRKEVIQPHLPVRLPCYDLVLIASPTFDGSLSCELGHRLRVLPTFMT